MFRLIRKDILFILLILVINVPSFAQNPGRLRGFVTDSTNGEVLPFCNVFISELQTGASTDQRGYFLINAIPSRKTYNVEFSYVGYETKVIRAIISPGKITELNVELSPINYQYQAIEKIEKRITKQEQFDLGVERLTLRKLETLPQSVEADVLRSLKYLPGVKSTGDLSAKYYVRGGTGDQNLVLLNGVTLYNPFHALGLFSVIDAEMVNSLEFYKGDFAPEYGGRVSSIMNIVTRDGNKNKFSATAGVSFLTGKLLLEIPYSDGSIMLTGRKSHSTKILNKFLSQDDVPIDFYDFSFKMNFSNQNFLKNGKYTAFGFFSSDILDDPNKEAEDFKWKNNLVGLEWVQIYDAPLFSKFQFSFSNFTGEVVPNDTEVKPRYNSVNDFTFDAEFVYVWPSKDQITFGLSFKNVRTKLEQENENSSVIKLDDFSGNYVFYSKYQLLRFEEFGLDGGIRFYLSGLSNRAGVSLEPRIKGFWNPIPQLIFKGSIGTYRQEIATITDENEVISLFDPWTIYPDYLEATRSLNTSLGITYFIKPNISVNVEGYYRSIKNFAAVNDRKIFPGDPELVNGDGEAYGLENSVTWEENNYTLSAAYTLSWAYKTVDGFKFNPKYDSRHSVILGLSYNLPSQWVLGINWVYNSGTPYTPIKSYFDKYNINNFFNLDPRYINYSIYTILGKRNVHRLPDYHRLDISISKSLELGSLSLEISGSIINVYDRKNVFYFKRESGEIINMLPFLPTLSVKVKL